MPGIQNLSRDRSNKSILDRKKIFYIEIRTGKYIRRIDLKEMILVASKAYSYRASVGLP